MKERYLLVDAVAGLSIVLDDHAPRLAWLDIHHSPAFPGRQGQLNSLKETRQGAGYCYAHRCR